MVNTNYIQSHRYTIWEPLIFCFFFSPMFYNKHKRNDKYILFGDVSFVWHSLYVNMSMLLYATCMVYLWRSEKFRSLISGLQADVHSQMWVLGSEIWSSWTEAANITLYVILPALVSFKTMFTRNAIIIC